MYFCCLVLVLDVVCRIVLMLSFGLLFLQRSAQASLLFLSHHHSNLYHKIAREHFHVSALLGMTDVLMLESIVLDLAFCTMYALCWLCLRGTRLSCERVAMCTLCSRDARQPLPSKAGRVSKEKLRCDELEYCTCLFWLCLHVAATGITEIEQASVCIMTTRCTRLPSTEIRTDSQKQIIQATLVLVGIPSKVQGVYTLIYCKKK